MFLRIGQWVFFLVPLAVLIWLARIELVPDGVFEIDHTVGDVSPYIDALAPQDRLADERTLIGDPVYFFLHPHRHFDLLEFELWFQNRSVPIVEFGGLVEIKPDVYDLRPIHNAIIDSLAWPTATDGTFTLHQKTKRYDSIDAFFADPPARENVAVYRADYGVPFRLPGYTPSPQPQTLDLSLRGRHELKTYLKNETLDLRVEYMDMNRDEGADPVTVTVFNERGEPVVDARAQDDGDTRAQAIASPMKELRVTTQGLPEGVYKLVWNASRDIFVRKIHTTQQKLVFVGGVYLGDEVAYRAEPHETQAWTASKRIRAQTRHASGVQTLTREGETYDVASPYEMYTFKTDGELRPIHVPQGDIELWFDGPLSFTREQYFQPDPHVIRPYTDIPGQGIEYILTSYQSPRAVGDWLVQTVSFDTAPLSFEKKAWKFTFSVPDITEQDGTFTVDRINMRWHRKPFAWGDVLELLRGIWND